MVVAIVATENKVVTNTIICISAADLSFYVIAKNETPPAMHAHILA